MADHQPNDPSQSFNAAFRPCFIVGNERSGTTLLTVLLGRHSQLATTPETHFLSLIPRKSIGRIPTHSELLDRLFASPHTVDMKINRDRLTEHFGRYPADYASLFRALLEEYAAEHAPGKTRIGEKTPLHLLGVPTLLEWYPEAKIVCIVRDGRDVVLSLLNMSWNPEHRLRPLCMNWIRLLKIAEGYRTRFPEQFLLIRYEDLLDQPEQLLKQVDAFLGLPFEPEQLVAALNPPMWCPMQSADGRGKRSNASIPHAKPPGKRKRLPDSFLL